MNHTEMPLPTDEKLERKCSKGFFSHFTLETSRLKMALREKIPEFRPPVGCFGIATGMSKYGYCHNLRKTFYQTRISKRLIFLIQQGSGISVIA